MGTLVRLIPLAAAVILARATAFVQTVFFAKKTHFILIKIEKPENIKQRFRSIFKGTNLQDFDILTRLTYFYLFFVFCWLVKFSFHVLFDQT